MDCSLIWAHMYKLLVFSCSLFQCCWFWHFFFPFMFLTQTPNSTSSAIHVNSNNSSTASKKRVTSHGVNASPPGAVLTSTPLHDDNLLNPQQQQTAKKKKQKKNSSPNQQTKSPSVTRSSSLSESTPPQSRVGAGLGGTPPQPRGLVGTSPQLSVRDSASTPPHSRLGGTPTQPHFLSPSHHSTMQHMQMGEHVLSQVGAFCLVFFVIRILKGILNFNFIYI